jgi:hypothetical protein
LQQENQRKYAVSHSNREDFFFAFNEEGAIAVTEAALSTLNLLPCNFFVSFCKKKVGFPQVFKHLQRPVFISHFVPKGKVWLPGV